MAGKPAPGSVVIRAWVPRELHAELSVAATAEGLRMSEMIVRAVRKEVARSNRKRARSAA